MLFCVLPIYLISYATAWLKAHHPAAFLAGVLTHDPGMYPKRLILDDARNLGQQRSLGLAVALAASEQRRELIFSASPIALSVGDANDNFRITAVNAAWERLLKRSADEVRGLNGREIGLWADDADRLNFWSGGKTQS